MKEQELMFPAWQRPYLVALAPGSPETLRDRVAKAKKAILERLAKLVKGPEREMERFALRDALHTLHAIKGKPDFQHAAPGPTT
jgi:hypothetical protein